MARVKNISLGPDAQARLDELVKKAKASSASETVRNALRFYEYVVEESIAGSDFFVRKKGDKDSDLTKIKFIY
ncbi:MAG: ribbon-helix-helix protein, CopG family [Rhizomicrobium sp.]